MSDDTLLTILSNPTSIHSICPHLGSLFTAVRGVTTRPTDEEEEGESSEIVAVESVEGERVDLSNPVCHDDWA